MVKKHELTVLLADDVACDATFSVRAFVSARSLMVKTERANIRGFENECGFPPGHLGLKSTFVEGFAHGVDGTARSSECYETSTTL